MGDIQPRAAELSRRGFLIGGAGVLLAFAAACSSDSGDGGTGGTAGSGATIAHKYGETTVPANPQRVVSVGYNDQDALLALGAVPVGVFDWYGDYPYAVWPWAQELLGDAQPAIVGSASAGIDVEKVAAAAPDLVVATYSGLTQGQYDKLAALVPTVAQPAGVPDYGVRWQDQTTILGEALGRQDRAAELVAGLQKQFADTAAAHPSFAGKTVLVGALKGPGQFGVYGPDDPKVRFFTELGFVNPPVAEQLRSTNFAEISTEQLSLADVDLLVWYAGGGFGDKLRAELEKTPVYQTLDVVRDGRAIILDDEAAEAMTWSTVLSLPYALQQIPPRIAPLLA
ncbi:iron-siderophore ABC transporter substrate-binding protein [Rhodococcus sp. SGAir0479]|uniref:iron-siderophore ABC transporter substrate-binding protein n=1 Tax=Rhodococcus sp. SGAir0479 TaxID=2567884 RepID=UPI0010CD557C|nr:iron-siderophore ABC transporter substrate-binding protein [Rhodococcus sp. SGAir0479]QCQ91677.1 iron-siderophore ABC transporter substrate-binding protein [Rhodococcus sp. SGAir0479]